MNTPRPSHLQDLTDDWPGDAEASQLAEFARKLDAHRPGLSPASLDRLHTGLQQQLAAADQRPDSWWAGFGTPRGNAGSLYRLMPATLAAACMAVFAVIGLAVFSPAIWWETQVPRDLAQGRPAVEDRLLVPGNLFLSGTATSQATPDNPQPPQLITLTVHADTSRRLDSTRTLYTGRVHASLAGIRLECDRLIVTDEPLGHHVLDAQGHVTLNGLPGTTSTLLSGQATFSTSTGAWSLHD